MSDTTLYPTSYAITGTPNTVNPAVTVGPDPWEPDDSTYTETWRTTRPTGPPFYMLDQASGFWSAYADPVDDIVPYGRLEALQSNTTLVSRDVQIEMDDAADLGSPFVGWFRPFNSSGILPATGVVVEVAGADWLWEDQYGGTDKTRLISVLQAGNLKALVHIPQLPSGWTTASMAWGVRVHEFGLVVSKTATNPPQLRKYPNPTGLGVGPTRHWPRPRRGITGIR